MNIYPRGLEALEQARSFAHPGTRLGSWYGGYVPVPYGSAGGFYGQFVSRGEESERYYPWWQVLMHFDTPAWFVDYHLSGFEGAMAPDLRLFDCYKWTAEEIRELKSGIGKIILNSERLHDGIALYFSRASQLIAHALPEYGNHDYIERATLRVIEDLGLQYEWVSYEQIADGILGNGEYKVLFLPCISALSEKEVDEILGFARKGGTVIADIRPGIMDEHGKLLSKAQLDELFGVSITNSLASPVKSKESSIISTFGKSAGTYQVPSLLIHPHVSLAGGSAVGEIENIPVGIFNKFGKGGGIYLNFSFAEYYLERNFPWWNGFRDMMRDILHENDIDAPVKITLDGEPQSAVEIARFQDGGIQYITLLNDGPPLPEDEPVSTVLLPENAHIYNSREGTYLGYRRELHTIIRPARAQVFAMVPYKVESMDVEIDHPRVIPGESVSFSVALSTIGGKPGRHCIRIDVVDPDGKNCIYYGQNLFIYKGKGKGEIPLALNEKPGMWTLQVKDVTTGLRKVTTFVIDSKK